MNFEDFTKSVSEVAFGKRVRNDLYIHVDCLSSCPAGLRDLIEHVRAVAHAGIDFNVIKFSPLNLKISFLFYPDFHEKPHPELRSSTAVDLRSGKTTRHDYTESDNPPILHRKEALLSPERPLVEEYEALTREEEAQGLYSTGKVIGFKKNWELLLAEKGLGYSGHKLVAVGTPSSSQEADSTVEVLRHKTAIARYKFSRPIQTLLEYGLLADSTILLDYGCGQGDDVNGLREMGYSVSGWDPVYYPNETKETADIVNLGFVLNVIEEPVERMEVLHEAYELCRKLLVVSTLVATSETDKLGSRYRDGILTSRNTFQKYFRQDELEQYIEDVLHTSAVAVGLGIFYVFRSPSDQQAFLASRGKRTINWVDISRRIRPPREEKPRLRPRRPDVYERNPELLESFWARMLELGRVPAKHEFERYEELQRGVGSANKAKNLFVRRFGEETLVKAFDFRQRDLQVYLALSNFRKKVPFKHLPDGLRKDIKTFLGGYEPALKESQSLLFSAGNPEVIVKLCDETPFGYLDHQALYIHRGLVSQLDPVLRIYVGCAEVLLGDLKEIDVIKIHKRSGKVTLLKYDDFDGNPLPELQERIKVNLRRQIIDVFDHRSEERQELLYFKERYVAKDHPGRARWEEFSSWLERLGFNLEAGFGPTKQELLSLLDSRGITIDFDQQEGPTELSEQE